MELLSPAGNIEKLYYAYAYGADAAYIGLKNFSLRVKADNFYEDEYKKVIALKKQFPEKKLHCALNIAFHNRDIDNFLANLDYFKAYPIDAFIVQDLGLLPILQKYFPNTALHLSTQASCINREAVKMYKSLGFSRIVLGREAPLAEIREIKDACPDIELEAFCHGAMCIAYSGRCLMSAYMTGRSAQSGECTHSCRWDYDLFLREKKRPDEFYPVFEGDHFTAILSSKDLRMIEHLDDMKKAGLDSIKIEGRMKSVYYVAVVTRAYRKALDALDGKISQKEAEAFIAELENVSHRKSTTAFYYDAKNANETASGETESDYTLVAEIMKCLSDEEKNNFLENAKLATDAETEKIAKMHPEALSARDRDKKKHPDRYPDFFTEKKGYNLYEIKAVNMIYDTETIELISPNKVFEAVLPNDFVLVDPETFTIRSWVCDSHPCYLYTAKTLSQSTLIRVKRKQHFSGER